MATVKQTGSEACGLTFREGLRDSADFNFGSLIRQARSSRPRSAKSDSDCQGRLPGAIVRGHVGGALVVFPRACSSEERRAEMRAVRRFGFFAFEAGNTIEQTIGFKG